MMRRSSKACPLAYCPPGRGFSLSSDPRALPPVTQSSALQAPERLWFFFTTDYADRTDECPMAWQSSNTIRAGQMPHKSLCCLEGSTPKDGFFFYHGLNEVALWRKEEIKTK